MNRVLCSSDRDVNAVVGVAVIPGFPTSATVSQHYGECEIVE